MTTRRAYFHTVRIGLTMLEMIISLAIIAVFMAAVLPQLRSISENWDSRAANAETIQNARVLIEHMNRNLSKANSVISVSDSDNSSGHIEFIGNDSVVYRYELANTNYIEYSIDGTAYDLAGPVNELKFRCYQLDPLQLTTEPDEIRLIEADILFSDGTGNNQDKPITTSAYVRTNTSDCLCHWKMNETSGSTMIDEYQNQDGTYYYGVGIGPSPVDTYSSYFDEYDDYIIVPHWNGFLIDKGTITLWINADDIDHNDAFFSKDASGYVTGGHVRIGHDDDKFFVRLQSRNNTYYVWSDEHNSGQWYHIAFSFGTEGMKLYVDGVLEDTESYTGGLGPSSGDIGNYEPILLGGDTSYSDPQSVYPINDLFGGYMDDVRIFKKQLSDAEILALATAPLLGPMLAVDKTIELKNYSAVDSYSSAFSYYGGFNQDNKAVLSSNSILSYTIKVLDFCSVGGNIYGGPGGTVNSMIWIAATASLNGSKGALDNEVPVTSISLPGTIPASQGDYTLSGSTLVTINSDKHYNNLEMTQSSGMIISGNVTIIVDNDLQVIEQAKLFFINASSTLDLYVGNDAYFKNDAIVNSSNRPGNLRILMTGAGKTINLENNAQLSAIIYNPDGLLEMKDNSQLYGNYLGEYFIMNNYSKAHLDSSFTFSSTAVGSNIPVYESIKP